MGYQPSRSWIELAAVRLGIIPNHDRGAVKTAASWREPAQAPADSGKPLPLARYPSADQWDDFIEFNPREWPNAQTARRYRLTPTTCFNCESACGLLAYVDKETGQIRKFEGNPLHPGSRGKNCAKGPATLNQVNDPDRILTPLKRVGKRGAGNWAEVSWAEALSDIGGRIRKALLEGRKDEVVYHVGRPGAEGFIDRVLRAWGVDGHNSHTNICSSGARLGYALWSGYDRPTPDYANARFILALNAHLESGHYFNPMAQRISEGLKKGARMAVVDPRLSNTASMATHWLPTKPGTEAALLLAFACVILKDGLVDKAFVERWVNWREFLEAARKGEVPGIDRSVLPASGTATVDDFLSALQHLYADFTPDYAALECGVSAELIVKVARLIGEAGSRFCSHTWRGAASAHLGGWQVSRCLMLLHALTGSVGTEGGMNPSAWSKYKASLINVPPPQDHWNELHWPREYPLTHYEMSFLLPHFLKDGRGRIDTYFTRVFNPVWTYPDGFVWIEALSDEQKVGLHVALTPTWNETAFFADYVLPMGHGPERHDLNTYETHSGTWVAFRQPVLKAHALADGRPVRDTRDVNPGKVWEEDEFWIALTWAIDPDGALGIRKWFESQKSPGEMLSVDEYYAYAFERVPGLKEQAACHGLVPLEYMRKFGAYEVKQKEFGRHERKLTEQELAGATVDPATGLTRNAGGAAIGVSQRSAIAEAGPTPVEGFATPSRLLEFYNQTMVDWGWPEYALPGYIISHIWEARPAGPAAPQTTSRPSSGDDRAEFCLLPTFRLPTLIHTRSGAAKWLNEISNQNPLWVHPSDAQRLGLSNGAVARVSTRIGYFVDRVWVTESIRPGVVACSHHLGRWRRQQDPPNSRWSANKVDIREVAPGQYRMRVEEGPRGFASSDPDSRRIWWRFGGVHQNITFPVQPDPISGMHCWHQRVTVERGRSDDHAGDVFVDTNLSMEVYREWLQRTRFDAVERLGLRRPRWLNRPLRPTDRAYEIGRG